MRTRSAPTPSLLLLREATLPLQGGGGVKRQRWGGEESMPATIEGWEETGIRRSRKAAFDSLKDKSRGGGTRRWAAGRVGSENGGHQRPACGSWASPLHKATGAGSGSHLQNLKVPLTWVLLYDPDGLGVCKKEPPSDVKKASYMNRICAEYALPLPTCLLLQSGG